MRIWAEIVTMSRLSLSFVVSISLPSASWSTGTTLSVTSEETPSTSIVASTVAI